MVNHKFCDQRHPERDTYLVGRIYNPFDGGIDKESLINLSSWVPLNDKSNTVPAVIARYRERETKRICLEAVASKRDSGPRYYQTLQFEVFRGPKMEHWLNIGYN